MTQTLKNHLHMHLLLESYKLQNIQEKHATRKYGDTCLGEDMSWCTCHKGTRCTQHNLQIKFSLVDGYMHDAMIKILELFIKLKIFSTHKQNN
jgi:hypothetical protein